MNLPRTLLRNDKAHVWLKVSREPVRKLLGYLVNTSITNAAKNVKTVPMRGRWRIPFRQRRRAVLVDGR